MTTINGISPTGTTSHAAVSKHTKEWCSRYGLNVKELPVYLVKEWDRPLDIVRLTSEQFALIPEADRPPFVTERNGREHLLYLPADA